MADATEGLRTATALPDGVVRRVTIDVKRGRDVPLEYMVSDEDGAFGGATTAGMAMRYVADLLHGPGTAKPPIADLLYEEQTGEGS